MPPRIPTVTSCLLPWHAQCRQTNPELVCDCSGLAVQQSSRPITDSAHDCHWLGVASAAAPQLSDLHHPAPSAGKAAAPPASSQVPAVDAGAQPASPRALPCHPSSPLRLGSTYHHHRHLIHQMHAQVGRASLATHHTHLGTASTRPSSGNPCTLPGAQRLPGRQLHHQACCSHAARGRVPWQTLGPASRLPPPSLAAERMQPPSAACSHPQQHAPTHKAPNARSPTTSKLKPLTPRAASPGGLPPSGACVECCPAQRPFAFDLQRKPLASSSRPNRAPTSGPAPAAWATLPLDDHWQVHRHIGWLRPQPCGRLAWHAQANAAICYGNMCSASRGGGGEM